MAAHFTERPGIGDDEGADFAFERLAASGLAAALRCRAPEPWFKASICGSGSSTSRICGSAPLFAEQGYPSAVRHGNSRIVGKYHLLSPVVLNLGTGGMSVGSPEKIRVP